MLGEARLFDAATRVAAIDTVAVGTADGVTGHRERREITIDDDGKRLVEEFVITIENTRARPVEVVLREHLYRGQNWTLAYQTAAEPRKEGPQQISLRTRVPPSRQGQGPVRRGIHMAVIANVAGLTIHYGKRLAVDGLSFELAAGEIALLLGPNGAGKSTTLSAMAGAVVPTAGTIRSPARTSRPPRAARARKVGFADQPPALYEFFTVAEHVGFVAEARGSDAAAAAAVLADLGLVEDRPAPVPRAVVRHAPARRASPPRSSARSSSILLDETLNGLDPHASRSARAALRAAAERGAAILMSTHLLGVAERMCDRILVMDKGKLVADRRGDDLRDAARPGPVRRRGPLRLADRRRRPDVTSRELHPLVALHERRARTGGVLASPLVLAVLAGGALAGWVAWRSGTDPVAASRAWLAGALAAFALAFMRVPFHLYWRGDAALLAQLPIDGGPLFDAALWRCVRAAATTTLAVAIGALPLARISTELGAALVLRHLAIAGRARPDRRAADARGRDLGRVARRVSQTEAHRRPSASPRASIGERAARPTATQPPAPSTALLGALPGFASTVRDRRYLGDRARGSSAATPRSPRASSSARSPAPASLAILATRAARPARDGHDPARRLRARPPAPRDARDPPTDRARARDRARDRRRGAALTARTRA